MVGNVYHKLFHLRVWQFAQVRPESFHVDHSGNPSGPLISLEKSMRMNQPVEKCARTLKKRGVKQRASPSVVRSRKRTLEVSSARDGM
nr:hypothetical protein [Mycobacterium arosiense]